MPTKNDIQTGIDAAKENDTKSFDQDDVDARKKRVEKARKLLEEYPPEEPQETTAELEKSSEEPKTTVAGAAGAMTRGLAPYAAGAAAFAPLGLLGGPFAPITVPMAAAGGAASVGLAEAFTPMVNAALGTNVATPREAMNTLLDWAGVAKPTSKSEKILEKFSEMAGSGFALPLAAEQAASQVASPVARKVLSTLAEKPIEQALATGAMGAAGEVARQQGAGPLQQLGIEFATGALTPTALKSLKVPSEIAPKLAETTKKALSGDKEAQSLLAQSAAATTPEITEAISKLKFEETPTQFTSISPQYQALSQRATTAAGSLVEQEQKQFLDQLKTKAGEIISKAGGTEDLSSLSDEIKTSMLDKIKDLDSQDDVLYSQIRKIAKPETQTNLTNALDAVKSKLKNLGGNAELLSPIEKQILSALSPKPVINEVGETVGISKPTIEAIRTLKSKVGSILSGEKTFPNETIGNAKYYYGKLADDYHGSIQPILEAFGQPELLENANAIVRQRKGIEENAINLFGDELSQSISGKVSKAGTVSAKGDADAIQNILKSVPEEYKPEIIGSAIRNAVTQQGEFNIDNFVNWYGGIKNQKESYKALFESLDPSVREEMDALYTISKNVRDSLKGKIKQSEMALISDKSLSLAQKIKKYVPVALGYGAFAASHKLGVPLGLDAFIGYALHQGSKQFLTKTQRATIESLDEFLSSKQFADLVAKSKGDPTVFSRMSSEIVNTPVYKRFAQKVGPEVAKRALQVPAMPDEKIDQSEQSK